MKQMNLKAVVFADRCGAELAPLTDKRPVAFLPIAGRTVIDHVLATLSQNGVRDAWIVCGPYYQYFRNRLECVQKFGVRLNLIERVAELKRDTSEPILMVRGDMLPNRKLTSEIVSRPHHFEPRSELIAAGLMLSSARLAARHPLAFSSVVEANNAMTNADNAGILTSLADFHQTNLEAVRCDRALDLPGEPTADGLILDQGAVCDSVRVQTRAVHLGEFATVSRRARIEGSCVIGAESVISKDAQLQDVVVMPKTYVGAGLKIRDAIVDGHNLIQIKKQVVAHIEDPAIIANC